MVRPSENTPTSATANSSQKRGGQLNSIGKLTLLFLVYGTALLGLILISFEVPNKANLLGKERNLWILARLDGNHIEPEELGPATTERLLIIGHRGSGEKSTSKTRVTIGNTESAIEKAIEAGVNWIEIDIRMTKDEKLVVFHDSKVGGKTDANPGAADKLPKDWSSLGINQLTWDQLQNLHLTNEGSEPILSLDQVRERFNDPDLIWVYDIKAETSDDLNIKKRSLITPILNELGPERVRIFGTAKALDYYSDCDPQSFRLSDFEVGLVVDKTNNILWFVDDPSSIVRSVPEDIDYLVVPGLFASSSLIKQANEQGHQVLVWDCENDIDQKHYVARGAAGLIVDYPKKTKSNLGLDN